MRILLTCAIAGLLHMKYFALIKEWTEPPVAVAGDDGDLAVGDRRPEVKFICSYIEGFIAFGERGVGHVVRFLAAYTAVAICDSRELVVGDASSTFLDF